MLIWWNQNTYLGMDNPPNDPNMSYDTATFVGISVSEGLSYYTYSSTRYLQQLQYIIRKRSENTRTPTLEAQTKATRGPHTITTPLKTASSIFCRAQ